MKIKSQFTRHIEKDLIKNKIRRKKELLRADRKGNLKYTWKLINQIINKIENIQQTKEPPSRTGNSDDASSRK